MKRICGKFSRIHNTPRLIIANEKSNHQPSHYKILKLTQRLFQQTFRRVELNVENALKSIYETNPDALMFGTVLPSTRTKRPFEYGDIELIQHLFDEQATDKILYTNALKWYFK